VTIELLFFFSICNRLQPWLAIYRNGESFLWRWEVEFLDFSRDKLVVKKTRHNL